MLATPAARTPCRPWLPRAWTTRRLMACCLVCMVTLSAELRVHVSFLVTGHVPVLLCFVYCEAVYGISLCNSVCVSVFFSGCAAHTQKESQECNALLMDEVDGMAGNEDRGGMQVGFVGLQCTAVCCMCACASCSLLVLVSW